MDECKPLTSGDGAVSLTVRDTAAFPATAGDINIDDAFIDGLTRERRGGADYDGNAVNEIAASAAAAAAAAAAPPSAAVHAPPATNPAPTDQTQPSERTGRGLHSSTYSLNLSRFSHRNQLRTPSHGTEGANVELKSGRM